MATKVFKKQQVSIFSIPPTPRKEKKTDTKEINKKTHKTRNSWEQLCFKGHQNHWIESTAKKDDRRHPELHRIGHQC